MNKFSEFKKFFFSVLALTLVVPGAYAAVSEVGSGDFGPATILIDFDDFPNGDAPIPGFTVSGAGYHGVQDGSAWGGTSDPGRKTFTIGGPIELTFNARVTRVGFTFGGNTPNDVPFQVRRNGITTGSFNLTSTSGAPDGTTNWYFLGYQDPDGIDSIWFDVEQTSDWVFGIYDLMLDDEPVVATSSTPIPTLSSFSLLLTTLLVGLIGVFYVRRRVNTQSD